MSHEVQVPIQDGGDHDNNNQHGKKMMMMVRDLNPHTMPNNHALKISGDSHVIKKSPPSSSASSSIISGVAANATPAARPLPRQPVIIYTHSPKVIHTHPKDFKALVQKLTGLSRSPALAAADRRTSRPAPPPPPPPPPLHHHPKPEPCDHYIVNGTINNNSESNNNNSNNNNYNYYNYTNSNKNYNDNNNVEMMAKIGLMSEDNDSTSVVTDEKEGSCSASYVFEPQNNNSNNSFDNNEYMNNNNNNNMDYFHPTSMDFLCPSSYSNYVDSLLLMRSSISSLESMKDLPDF
ncbi:unnamed protein product [Cuscuta europaea]|uniref:VQ domain-containing protein n=1 Tax=Cuscuta europaea TaxID=41803 RepID=A0A9P0YZ67_CUSEU|nr:unnamed protein product [Cuscuta europaea]